MSLKSLGNKQTIVLHNCEINNQKYDRVITPHTQTVGYIRTKRQTIKNIYISKQRQITITRKRFSKHRNAFSESEVSSLDELYRSKDSVNKNCPILEQLYFSDSETTSKQEKYKKKKEIKTQTSTSIQLESTNQAH